MLRLPHHCLLAYDKQGCRAISRMQQSRATRRKCRTRCPITLHRRAAWWQRLCPRASRLTPRLRHSPVAAARIVAVLSQPGDPASPRSAACGVSSARTRRSCRAAYLDDIDDDRCIFKCTASSGRAAGAVTEQRVPPIPRREERHHRRVVTCDKQTAQPVGCPWPRHEGEADITAATRNPGR